MFFGVVYGCFLVDEDLEVGIMLCLDVEMEVICYIYEQFCRFICIIYNWEYDEKNMFCIFNYMLIRLI